MRCGKSAGKTCESQFHWHILWMLKGELEMIGDEGLYLLFGIERNVRGEMASQCTCHTELCTLPRNVYNG